MEKNPRLIIYRQTRQALPAHLASKIRRLDGHVSVPTYYILHASRIGYHIPVRIYTGYKAPYSLLLVVYTVYSFFFLYTLFAACGMPFCTITFGGISHLYVLTL